MREIKFRVWIEELNNKSWMNYCELKSFNDINWSKNIMQYTWLKDKNWKEIYEWDIMKSCYWDLTTIIFNDENWRFEWNKSFWCSHKDMKDLLRYGWEIIWNIYENPELLK
jgi:hypothetical protein